MADGTAGLRLIDLATPGGSRDDDHDGLNDRVLGTLDLGGARAQRVAPYRVMGDEDDAWKFAVLVEPSPTPVRSVTPAGTPSP
ncbi:MAG: hypothetical protein ACHQ4J_07210 [Candidatus Binatia bacterium]